MTKRRYREGVVFFVGRNIIRQAFMYVKVSKKGGDLQQWLKMIYSAVTSMSRGRVSRMKYASKL
ncbi:hypothetical protein [Bacillus sp. B1-WWTP-T-0.5-Post-4]|uniref:hypothetical protein n=1 Tax=Bacillus sp. B1-WWTP-T-0.5-Post-4 TaxID=2653219 RepID=UPI00186A8971|nr:hypothetical protein [Bacillus sp. B1-WWTP-T-0.5-Post-4]